MTLLSRSQTARIRHRKSKSSGAAPRRRRLLLEALEDRRLLACDAVPSASLSGFSDSFIGEPTRFTATFDNTGTDPGFGPYIDLIIPATGTDGDDGVNYFVATHLNVQLTPSILTFDALGQAIHPYAVDSSDNPIVVTHPLGASGAGDQLVVLQLPFGSFTDTQTPAEVNITADLSDLADLGTALTIYASGGFQYGCDALDNPATDPSILGSQTSGTINPRVFEADKVYNGPEGDETATGPNYVQSYDLVVNIADGQPISNLVIQDLLPPNHVYVGVPSVAINGNLAVLGTDYTLTDVPPTVSASPWTAPSSQNDLQISFAGTITGTASATDVVVAVQFYIAESSEGTPPPVVIDPSTGDEVLEDNTVNAQGYWVPLDPRDPAATVSDSATYEDLEERSIAIQKSVSVYEDNGEPGVSPGDILEWTLDFQISDFFAFDNLFLTDVLSDGLEFFEDDDSANGPFVAAPSATITEAGVSTGSLAFALSATPASPTVPFFSGAVNYYVYPPSATDGTTEMQFDLSKLLRDQTPPVDDQLVGGLFLDRDDNLGPTTGTITFYTRVLDRYREDFPSGDPSLNENDVLDNDIDIDGDILAANLTDIVGQEDDQGAASTAVPQGEFVKQVYAVNGITLPVPPPDPLVLVPGDEVTFRVRYDLFLGDFELFTVSDFLPLPIFRAADPDADNYPTYTGTTTYTTTDPLTGTPPTGVPAAGQWQRGPADTHTEFADFDGNGTPGDVKVTVDFASNSVTWELGTYDDPDNEGGIIDLLFTVTATGDPFADGLFLTNQATKGQQNTFQEPVEATDIRQVQIGEPELSVIKGVIATDNPAGVFSPATVAPAAVTPPGSAGFRFGGIINSSGLAATPINSNLSGIDAGDLVTFAIVVENTGNSRRGAFDVQIRDTLPDGFAIPTDGAGLNLRVTDGSGDAYPFTFTELGDGGGDDLFGDGIRLDDPGPTPATGSGTSLETDAGAIDQYDATDGHNIAVITYDLIAVGPPDANAVQPRQTLTNTATLFNYASREGGPDFTEDDLTEDADVTIAAPTVNKTILTTNQIHTTGTNVAIGELVQYRAVITVPEGTSSNVRLVDLLDAGLAHMGADTTYPISITQSPGISTSVAGGFSYIATHPAITSQGSGLVNQGRVMTLDFGTITNTDNDNEAETIEVTYWVVVINGGSNDRGDQRNNRADWRWEDDFGPQQVRDSAPNVRIVEPVMQVDKTAAPHIGDQGDTITFTLDVRHNAVANNAHAYNVTLSDVIPAGLTYVGGSLEWTEVGIAPATLSEAGGTITAEWPAFLTTNTSQLQFQATVDIGVPLGSVITNTAGIEWTSLPGDVSSTQSAHNPLSVERTGDPTDVGGSDNDYRASDSDEVAIQNPAMTKVLVTPAAPHEVTIGQTLTYEITLTIPEGTAGNAVLTDSLDAGLAIVDFPDLGTAISVVADPALITSLGDPATFDYLASVGAGGGTLTLNFGSLTNTDTNNVTPETIVITYDVVVLNEAVNTAGHLANNSAVFASTAGTLAASALDITIVEPDLHLTKSNSVPLVAEAGDRVVFTFVVEHTAISTADAYDVVLTDLLTDYRFTYDHTDDPLDVVSGPAPDSVSESPAAGDLTVVWNSFPLGSVTVLSVPVTLDADTPIGLTLNNIADLTWTSLPGDVTAPQSTNPVSVERTGDPLDPGDTLNGYTEQGTGITQTPVPTFIKQVDSTSHDGTGSGFHNTGREDVAIGEEVAFLMIGLVPDGEIHTLPLTDTLPVGMELVDAVVLAVGDDIYKDAAFTNPLTPAEVIVNTTPTTVEYVFPEYIYNDPNPAEPGALDNTFLFEVTAVVTNVASNQDGVTLTNTALAGYYDPYGNPQTLPAYAYVDVVEPDLTITKVANPTSGVGGDVITFTMTVNHTAESTANAYDVEIADILPPEMTYVGNLQLINGFLPAPSQVGQTLTFSWSEIPYPPASPGPTDAPYTFTFDVMLNANLQVGQTVTNDALVTWQSLPGATDNIRDGSGGLAPGVLNDYAATDGDGVTSDVTARNAAKSLVVTSESSTGDPAVAIGEIARYRLQLEVDQGTIPDLRLTDLLPDGVQFLNDGTTLVALVANTPANITSSTLPDTDGSGNPLQQAGDETTLSAITPTYVLPGSAIGGGAFGDGTDPTFLLGNMVNAEHDANLEFVVVEFNALVRNVGGNQSGSIRSNSFQAYSNTTLLDTSDPVEIGVVEPSITNVSKTITAFVGDVVTYQVTYSNTGAATAFDVRLEDVLPGGLVLNPASIAVTLGGGAAGADTSGSSGNTVAVLVGTMPVGGSVTVTYNAIAANNEESTLNAARVTYTSLPGPNGTLVNPTGSATPGGSGTDTGERDSSDGAGGAVDDYADSDSASVAVVSGQKRDTGGTPLAGVTIYLDVNDNGAFDLGEPYDVTDANGNYFIVYLSGDVHTLRELVPDYYVPDNPAAGAQMVDFRTETTVTDVDFVNRRVAPQILDDGDPNVSFDGEWIYLHCESFYDSDARFLCGTIGGENAAQWRFTGLTPGATYQVSATWFAGAGQSLDAPYTVTGGSEAVTAVIDQRLQPGAYPGSFADQGFLWVDLTSVYTIFGDTLTVTLTDAHSGGCLVADAIRVIQVTTPEISVWDGGASLTDGVSQVDLGETNGPPLPREFTIRNEGGATLSLGEITLPLGYRLAADLGQRTLLPGQSTTFEIELDATTAGTYSGWITVGNNDNDEAPFSFAITGTVGSQYAPTTPPPGLPPEPPPVAAPESIVLLDGFDVLYPAISTVDYGATSVGQVVTRTFTILNPATATSDVTLGTLAVPAGFTTDYAAAGMVLAPGGTLDFDLTLAAVSAGTLAGDVALSGTGGDLPFVFLVSGQVVAGPPPLTAPLYIDNGDAGYSDTIGFYRRSLSGYLGDYELASGDANGDYAEWTFTNLPEGAFSVAASYWARYNWTDAAQYTVRLFDPATNVTTDFGPYSVNQRVAPDDIYDQGIWWEQLRASLPVPSGATLTVRLTDQGGGSKVVADAIRVEQLTRPEITVLDGGVELTSGSSVVDFGATPAGTPVSRTLTVRNDGGGPLQLPVSITVPGGFTLTAPLGNPLLASGQSTDFTIQLDAGVSGTFSGPISFENSDADESPFLFTIQGSVTLGVPTLTEPIYIDNGDVGYTDTPGFFKRSLAGYQGDYELASGDASGDYAQWEFVGLPGGTFSVATSYWARYNWTDAAQYTVTIAGMQYGPYSVNQREAPDDIYDQGLGWAQLGSVFTVPNGATLTVRLTDEGGGYKVVADAVRVEQLSPLLGELPASGVTGAEVSVLEAVPTSVVQQAAVLWSAAESQAADRLANVAVIVADLPGQTLGLASAWTQTIWLDADAAGQGWAVIGHQSSVIGREPLVPGHRSPITGFDLLTVIAHELGHVLGLEHADDEHNVMAETLPAGVRRLPPSAAGARFGTAASSAGDALWAAGAEVSVRRVDRDADEASRRADAGLAALLDEPSAAWAPADEQVAQLTAGLRKRSADPKQRLDEALASVGDWLDPLDAILRDL